MTHPPPLTSSRSSSFLKRESVRHLTELNLSCSKSCDLTPSLSVVGSKDVLSSEKEIPPAMKIVAKQRGGGGGIDRAG